ncbi:oxygenase MpaB family protein [Cellulomonas fimi]|uniref:oxygenase MpaB family protein n=1 Tax=Cellulomonas fimi TaxID=1708 RepID=UPI002358D3B3|nr:oxygenase MpaB family protein [Cellulomonas fimi]
MTTTAGRPTARSAPRAPRPGPRTWVADARREAGTRLFLRVAGPDGVEQRERIHGTPGPRWFPPGSAIRTVHGDASMFVGGLRALLLQSLHPAAMAAVGAHSGYRGDPWGRLARTSTFLADTVFGTADDAAAAVERVRAVHRRIRGRTPDGIDYAADDPRLLRWVHVAEIDSFLRAHRRYGVHPLDDRAADEYVAQAAVVGRALGAAKVPTTVAGLAAAIEDFRPVLGPSVAARDAAQFLLHEPPVPRSMRAGYVALVRAAVASLPGWALDDLGVAPPGRVRRRVDEAAGAAATRTVRWLLGADDAGRVTHGDHASSDPAA